MSIINYAAKVINFKVVYDGPGLAGKTANLQYIHRCLPETNKGKMVSLATGAYFGRARWIVNSDRSASTAPAPLFTIACADA